VRISLRRFRIVRRKRKIATTTHYKDTYIENKEAARKLIRERLDEFAPRCEAIYNRVAIKDHTRRWGSCSSLGNLNFNYRLLFLPACLRDYVIIHELCHLKEFNHGPQFWQEVAKLCPQYEACCAELRHIERETRLSIVGIKRHASLHTCRYCEEVTAKVQS
jgi:predicted metal-dependent hydrolase